MCYILFEYVSDHFPEYTLITTPVSFDGQVIQHAIVHHVGSSEQENIHPQGTTQVSVMSLTNLRYLRCLFTSMLASCFRCSCCPLLWQLTNRGTTRLCSNSKFSRNKTLISCMHRYHRSTCHLIWRQFLKFCTCRIRNWFICIRRSPLLKVYNKWIRNNRCLLG